MRSESVDDAGRWKAATIILAVLLFVAVAGDILLYRHATRPLVVPGTEAMVADVQRDAARFFRRPIDKDTFPISFELERGTCVELRPLAHDWRGVLECRDKDGRKTEERTVGGGF